ncbi:MAG: hypothetical protein JSW27_14205 [Phycisphaerales bacterium]|nr:MAG: hypothetical protein JSW27_14205 [Phycisphaerales bacterium]
MKRNGRLAHIVLPKSAKAAFAVAGLCLCIALLLTCGHRVLRHSRASDLFREYVLDPIPASVTDIEVVQPKERGGYGYVFRFGVNGVDYEQILKSQPVPFREAYITNDLNTGSLSWQWKGPPVSFDGYSFTFFGPGPKPSWFDLPSWDDVEVYALSQRDKDWDNPDIQVLIFNATLEQAYFIVFDYGGDAIWG